MRRLLLLIVSFACAAPAVAQTRRAMTVDDVLDLVQVSAPRISPDGRRVLYTKSELALWKDNKRTSTIWIVDADGSHARLQRVRDTEEIAWLMQYARGIDWT